MHCPNCGTQAASEQKFCRSCGFDLKPVSQLVTGQTVEGVNDNMPTLRMMLVRALKTLLGTLAFAAILLLLMYFSGALDVSRLGFKELMIIFWSLLFYLVLVFGGGLALAILLKQLHAKNPAPQANKLPEAPPASVGQTTDKLLAESPLEPVSSITEQTTRALEEARKPNHT